MPFATINDHSLHYTDIAPSDKQEAPLTLIFAHGLGSTQNFFFPILPYLTAYRCILFDNYGAGRSKHTGDETSIPAISKDVLGLLDHLHTDKAVVVGFSMSGMIPTYTAATAPNRVIAGICIGPVHPTKTTPMAFKQRIEIVRRAGMEAMGNSIPGSATGTKATPLHKAFIREMIMSQDPEGYTANCQASATASPPEYAKVRCPILIIAGEQDQSAPLAGCKHIFNELGTDISKKRMEVLPGVGHWICVEAGDDVGALIKGFCEGL